MELRTDSQASIDIMEKMASICSLRDMLAPEMDIALEIYHKRQQHTWVHWKVTKVESHIEELDAPDEFSWYCNNLADKLATEARSIFRI